MVCTHAQLDVIAKNIPLTLAQLRSLSGWNGAGSKVWRYGRSFLDVVERSLDALTVQQKTVATRMLTQRLKVWGGKQICKQDDAYVNSCVRLGKPAEFCDECKGACYSPYFISS